MEAITRKEQYYAYLTGKSDTYPEPPITREEKYLHYLCKNGGTGGTVATPEQIKEAVDIYFSENPVQPGATEEQAKQIQKNKEALGGISFSVTAQGILRASWEE